MKLLDCRVVPSKRAKLAVVTAIGRKYGAIAAMAYHRTIQVENTAVKRAKPKARRPGQAPGPCRTAARRRLRAKGVI